MEKTREKLEILFQNIDEPIEIPSRDKAVSPPPENPRHNKGSIQGAGSADFHIYRQQRRKETIRLQLIEQDKQMDEESQRLQEKQAEYDRIDRERTEKKRLKRLRRKK